MQELRPEELVSVVYILDTVFASYSAVIRVIDVRIG